MLTLIESKTYFTTGKGNKEVCGTVRTGHTGVRIDLSTLDTNIYHDMTILGAERLIELLREMINYARELEKK